MNANYESLKMRSNGRELKDLEFAERLCGAADPWAGCYLEGLATKVYVPRKDWAAAGYVLERAANACECSEQPKWAAENYAQAATMYEQAGLIQDAREARSLADYVKNGWYM